jgi:hypothetical protein
LAKLQILQVKTTNHDETARWFLEEGHGAEQALVGGRQIVDEKLWRRNEAAHVDSVLLGGIREGTFQHWNTHIRATPWQMLDLLCLRRQGSDGSRSQQRDNQKAEEAHKRSWFATIVVPMLRRRQLLQHRHL